MYTWEAAIMLHPYGWTGKQSHSPNSFGLSVDFASYHLWGADTSWAAYPNDTTSSRIGINLVLQQNLTGRGKARPKVGIYIEESFRFGWLSYGHYNPELWGNNHLTYGIGLAQGIHFLIFDLKFYQTLAISPDILVVKPELTFLRSMDIEFGLRLGVALKL
jgi:hypothetical protein